MKLSVSTVCTTISLNKLLTKIKCVSFSSHETKLQWFLPSLLNGCYDWHCTVEQVLCHPHVAGDEASRPVITEVLMYLDELETMTTDEEIPTPKFALHRVHDILFVFGGMAKNWRTTGYFQCYSTRTDRWTKVSCTQLHSYCAFLSNGKCPLNSNLFSDCTQHYITQFQQTWQ
jgi:hypothetical protein